jgi:hypothetical protein
MQEWRRELWAADEQGTGQPAKGRPTLQPIEGRENGNWLARRGLGRNWPFSQQQRHFCPFAQLNSVNFVQIFPPVAFFQLGFTFNERMVFDRRKKCSGWTKTTATSQLNFRSLPSSLPNFHFNL